MLSNQIYTTRNLHEKLGLDGILLLEKICGSSFKNVRRENQEMVNELTPQLQKPLIPSVDELVHFHKTVIGLHLCREVAFN